MMKGCWLAIGLAFVLTLMLWSPVSAAGPPEDGPDQDNGRRVGLVSTEARCLAVRGGVADSASATVRLQWEGQVEEAFLMLSVSGSQGGHSIYVNGRRVGSAPVRPGGPLCRPESPAEVFGATDMIPIPIEVLVRGENVITLTNDANVNDGWTAANLYLEIHGVLSGPPVASLEETLPASPLEVGAMATVSGTVALTSTYELPHVITQVVWYQIPMSYTGSVSVPLLIGVHGMGSSGEEMRNLLAAEADSRNWLLAAPDMHGKYYANTGEYALAYVGAQHDIVDTVEYMMSEYEVDPSRIYVAGGSMGGQTTAMMGAKYPDVFASAVPWKPFTDLTDWYYEVKNDLDDPYNTLTIIERETGGVPSEVPFEYERRSPMEMPQNSRLMPIKMWHDVDDKLVPIHHSRDLKDAINDNWSPPTPVTLIEVPSDYIDCDPDSEGDFEHCYDPPPADIFDFLSGFTLNMAPPLSLTIRTDESKPYYWLYIAQTGGDHWSEVEAAYSLADKTVTASISDTQPLTLALNLGSTPIMGPGGVNRPGMGLPATIYLVKGRSNNYLHSYTSGYLTTTLLTTGQYTLTISAIEAEVSANPNIVSAWQTATSTITAVVQDHLSNPIPDDTTIRFSTTRGTFPNGSSTYTTTVMGGGGQVTTTLTLTPAAYPAEIVASIESITASTSVDVIRPAIDLLVTPDRTIVYSEESVTYTYQITNTGDTTLTDVTVVDDYGTVCEHITLAAGITTSRSHSVILTQTTTNTATVTGQDPLGNPVTDSDSTAVNVISPAIEVTVTPDQTTIYSGQAVTYTYRITNTGDVALTGVILIDDNGTPVDSSDDITVCQDITLAAGRTTSCGCSATLTQTTTNTATVIGLDPLGNDVTRSDSATVNAISPAIGVTVTPDQTTIDSGQAVTYTYRISNSGDITLTGVTLVDDNGTPVDSSDDITVCESITLAAGATASCIRSVTLTQTTTNTVTVSGQDPLGNDVTRTGWAKVSVISPVPDVRIYLPIVTRK